MFILKLLNLLKTLCLPLEGKYVEMLQQQGDWRAFVPVTLGILFRRNLFFCFVF